MSLRQRQWASRKKAELVKALGGQCWNPDCESTAMLEIDHPHGRNWNPRKRELSWRISTYWREFQEGRIRLLCESCNSSKRFNGVELPMPQGLAARELMEPF